MTRQAMNQSIKRDKRGHAQTNAVCARCLLKASRACVCIYACMNTRLIVFLFVSVGAACYNVYARCQCCVSVVFDCVCCSNLYVRRAC